MQNSYYTTAHLTQTSNFSQEENKNSEKVKECPETPSQSVTSADILTQFSQFPVSCYTVNNAVPQKYSSFLF